MVRWLNVIAVLALLGSAVYAYRTKYETIFYAEQIAKLRNQNQRERDSIAVLQAEWAHLTRPTRIQSLADQHLDLKQLTVDQIVQVTDLPDQPPRQDIDRQETRTAGSWRRHEPVARRAHSRRRSHDARQQDKAGALRWRPT